MFKKFYNLFSKLVLDKNEKQFLSHFNTSTNPIPKKNNVLIISPNDYYYLCYNYLIFRQKLSNFNIHGYWPYSVHVTRIRLFQKFHEYKSDLYFDLLKKKYSKLYETINIDTLWDLNDLKTLFIDKSEDDEIIVSAKKTFNKLKNKDEILSLKLDGIYCGDLIYDSYIRFRNKPTVDINDEFLKKLIYLSILSIKCFKKLQKKFKYKYFYTTYSTYIHYGLLVRVLLQMNVKVYSGITMAQYNKKLTKKDYFSVDNYREFPKIFLKLNKKDQRLKLSKNMVNEIFFKNRKSLQFNDYMKVNPFKKNNKKLKKNYDGIVFLPNFFESQREWGKLVFPDLYEWINFTCDFIKKNKLNIAIKPHPNVSFSSNESNIVNELKIKYKDIGWINPSVSNIELFKHIKCGISAWGTILWELAYFNLYPISAGEHPACKYDIGFEPRSISQYEKILLSVSKLNVKNNIPKNKLLEYCYMYYLYNNDAYKTIAREINLNKVDFSNSSSLIKFIKKIKPYEKKL